MNSLVECIIDEITFNDLRVKQRSIGKLFPTFNKRVKAVASKGGVSLQEQMPTYWHFKVASGTKEGVKYDTYIQFVNLEEMIKKYSGDRRLWNKAGDNIDLRLLAAEILNNVDMKTSCSCPATLYWGQDYIRTQRDAQHGKQEERPPKIRNPKQYGAYCKHGQNLFNVLPAYTATFASFLKKFWLDEIESAVELSAEEFAGFKKVASELGQQAGEMPTRYDRSGEAVPYSKEFPPEGEEPAEEDLPKEEPEEDEIVKPTHPSRATKTAGEITPKATKPGVKRLGIEQELGPKDSRRKGKYKPKESVIFEDWRPWDE